MHQKTFGRESLGVECDLCTRHKPKTLSVSLTWTWLKMESFIPGISAAPWQSKAGTWETGICSPLYEPLL